jgi:hypothetical protein
MGVGELNGLPIDFFGAIALDASVGAYIHYSPASPFRYDDD